MMMLGSWKGAHGAMSLAAGRLGLAAVVLGGVCAGIALAAPGATIDKLNGVWVEGPGYDITYGGNYDTCAKRCLASERCVMIEYYRPEKKCNLYDTVRPRLSGGSSNVGIRR